MLDLNNLKARLQFCGGNAEGRMQEGKLKTLKKALIYSYQGATAVLPDGRMFRCLINPDKLKTDYDDKIISIPYEDVCLGNINDKIEKEEPPKKTSAGTEPVGLKVGDVFLWKETNTYWIVYLQRLEEDAYFRAEIRRCDHEVTIGEHTYKVYMRGPNQEEISWQQKLQLVWNTANYNAFMYIQSNEETLEYFHRFESIEVNGKPWEIQSVDSISTPGILQIILKEDYQNSIKDAAEAEKKPELETDPALPHIVGDSIVYPYDEKEYSIQLADNGTWIVDNEKKAMITSQTSEKVKLAIVTGRSGEVNLIYRRENEEDIVLHITIGSL